MNKLICNICNKQNILNNLFFVCNECNKNICPLCKLTHDKNHIIINYEDRDYICKKHNEPFNKYCKTCDEDICFICEDDHVGDEIDDLNEMLDNKNEFIIINQDLKETIEKFKCKINIMKEILNRMINMLEIYYSININFINSYSFNKINCFKLQNFITLKTYNEILIQKLDKAIKEDKVYEFSCRNFYNDNGEKYIGEMKNGVKDGKGILYFNKNNLHEEKSYEGDFKDDNEEGKGIVIWNNGNRYEGDFKNGKIDGKGKIYWNNDDI